MRLRNLKNREEIISNCPFLIRDCKNINIKKLFNNDHPLHIEIGCGKGKFIYQMALNNPDINFIGIEKYDNVLARAINKMPEQLPNLFLLNIDAYTIDEVFSKNVDTIYLNFSDPWPKVRHQDRRLTSPIFLKKYDNLFKNDQVIIVKTDNINLFAYSISSLSVFGYTINRVSLDLHNEVDIENVMTEYEEKFSNMGVKINYLYAKK